MTMFNTEQAAKIGGCSPKTINRLCIEGKLKAVQESGGKKRWMVNMTPDELKTTMDAHNVAELLAVRIMELEAERV